MSFCRFWAESFFSFFDFRNGSISKGLFSDFGGGSISGRGECLQMNTVCAKLAHSQKCFEQARSHGTKSFLKSCRLAHRSFYLEQAR